MPLAWSWRWRSAAAVVAWLSAQPGDLALGLLLLALQPGGQVRRPLLCAGGALAQGRKLDLSLLLLARPGGRRVAVRGLLVLSLSGVPLPGGRARLLIGRAGLLFLARSASAWRVATRSRSISARRRRSWARWRCSASPRVTLLGAEFHGRLLAQGFLAGHGLFERLAQAPHLGFGVAQQASGLLLLRVHLGLHGRDRLARGGQRLIERDAGLLEGGLALGQVRFLLGEGVALQLELAPGRLGLLDLHLVGLAMAFLPSSFTCDNEGGTQVEAFAEPRGNALFKVRDSNPVTKV